jgi:hypothetical protein
MKALQEEIMQEKQLPRRFYELDFGGLCYTKMIKNTPEHAMYASESENHPKEMRFH